MPKAASVFYQNKLFPTAKEKKEALKLRSHTRVISSHQPTRVQTASGEMYRKVEMASGGRSSGGQSWQSAENMESTLHTDNFGELLHDPVEVQLQKLLGDDADSFLHPVLREGAKKTVLPLTARKCEFSFNLYNFTFTHVNFCRQ